MNLVIVNEELGAMEVQGLNNVFENMKIFMDNIKKSDENLCNKHFGDFFKIYPEYEKDKYLVQLTVITIIIMAEEIRKTKQLRKDIDEVIQRVKKLDQSRETSLTITKLQEAVMWLGMNLKRLGDINPYPESKNPDSQRIEPTADGLKL